MSINKKLRELRKSAGLTQRELANKTGISLRAIINYENGLREPNSKAMVALEKFFNVSGEFLRGEADKSEFLQNSENINNELEQVIIQIQAFKNKYLISNQAEQLLAATALAALIKKVTEQLLVPGVASQISVDEMLNPFFTIFNLNNAGRTELNKRANELTQLKQYKK